MTIFALTLQLLSERSLSDAVLDTETKQRESVMGRGILLWLLGVPIPVIIILALLFR